MYTDVDGVSLDTKKSIRFYREDEEPYGVFSNYSKHPILLKGLRWPTTEHYFQVPLVAPLSSAA